MGKLGIQNLFVFSLVFVLMLIIPVIPLRMEMEGQYTNDKNILENLSSSDSHLSVDNLTLPEIDYNALNDAWINQKVEMLIIVNDSSFV